MAVSPYNHSLMPYTPNCHQRRWISSRAYIRHVSDIIPVFGDRHGNVSTLCVLFHSASWVRCGCRICVSIWMVTWISGTFCKSWTSKTTQTTCQAGRARLRCSVNSLTWLPPILFPGTRSNSTSGDLQPASVTLILRSWYDCSTITLNEISGRMGLPMEAVHTTTRDVRHAPGAFVQKRCQFYACTDHLSPHVSQHGAYDGHMRSSAPKLDEARTGPRACLLHNSWCSSEMHQQVIIAGVYLVCDRDQKKFSSNMQIHESWNFKRPQSSTIPPSASGVTYKTAPVQRSRTFCSIRKFPQVCMTFLSVMASTPYLLLQCSSTSSVETNLAFAYFDRTYVSYQGISCTCSLPMLVRAQFSIRQPLHQVLSGLGRLVGLEVQMLRLSDLDEYPLTS